MTRESEFVSSNLVWTLKYLTDTILKIKIWRSFIKSDYFIGNSKPLINQYVLLIDHSSVTCFQLVAQTITWLAKIVQESTRTRLIFAVLKCICTAATEMYNLYVESVVKLCLFFLLWHLSFTFFIWFFPMVSLLSLLRSLCSKTIGM